MLTAIVVEVFVGLIFLGIWFLVDKHTTTKNLRINQKEWEEYSKGMTYSQKSEVFVDWLKDNQKKHGWKFLYIPRM